MDTLFGPLVAIGYNLPIILYNYAVMAWNMMENILYKK
jgi:hypothetical protein